MHTKPLLIWLLTSVVSLSGCGGSEGDHVADDSSSRSVAPVGSYESWDSALAPCEKAREESVDQPLTIYIEVLHRLADEQKEACALFGLGTLYLQGYAGVDADVSKAKHYLELAAAAGVADAADLLTTHLQ